MRPASPGDTFFFATGFRFKPRMTIGFSACCGDYRKRHFVKFFTNTLATPSP